MAKKEFWQTVIGQGDKVPWPLPRLSTSERAQVQVMAGLTIFNTDTGGVQVYNGQAWIDIPSNMTNGLWTRVSANFGGLPGYQYIVDTTSTPVSMTLPTNPRVGDIIKFTDGGWAFASQPLTIIRNGSLIQGAAQNYVVDRPASGSLLFIGGSQGWKIFFSIDSLRPVLTTANFTAVSGYEYDCDTTAGVFQATLPLAPAEQDRIVFSDFAKKWSTNNFTIDGNGKLISGDSTLVCDVPIRIILIYARGAWNWLLAEGVY